MGKRTDMRYPTEDKNSNKMVRVAGAKAGRRWGEKRDLLQDNIVNEKLTIYWSDLREVAADGSSHIEIW